MKTVLSKYKHFDVSLQELKSVLGDDLYNVSDVTPEKVTTTDVEYAMLLEIVCAVHPTHLYIQLYLAGEPRKVICNRPAFRIVRLVFQIMCS